MSGGIDDNLTIIAPAATAPLSPTRPSVPPLQFNTSSSDSTHKEPLIKVCAILFKIYDDSIVLI